MRWVNFKVEMTETQLRISQATNNLLLKAKAIPTERKGTLPHGDDRRRVDLKESKMAQVVLLYKMPTSTTEA